MVPNDGNIFNHDMKNWVLKVDQDFRPEWFSEKFAEAEMRKAVKILWEKRFVINRTIKEIKEGRWFVGKGGTVQKVLDGGTVQKVLDGGTVQEVLGGTVQEVLGGTVQEVWGGTVQKVLDGGTVQKVLGGTVQEVLGGTVQKVWGGTVIIYNGSFKEIKNSGIVILRNENKIITAQDFKLEIKK